MMNTTTLTLTKEEATLLTAALAALPLCEEKVWNLPFDTQEEKDAYIAKRKAECENLYYNKIMGVFPDDDIEYDD